MHTMTLSASSIMLKSAMAWPTSRCRRLRSLFISCACLRARAASSASWALCCTAWATGTPALASTARAARANSRASSTMRSSSSGVWKLRWLDMGAVASVITGYFRRSRQSACSDLPGFHADGHFAVVKDLQLGNLHAHAEHAGQVHQALAQLADQGLEQVGVLGLALFDDDGAHLAVVQHIEQFVVARQQGLAAHVELGVDLNRLRRVDFVVKHTEAPAQAQAGGG